MLKEKTCMNFVIVMFFYFMLNVTHHRNAKRQANFFAIKTNRTAARCDFITSTKFSTKHWHFVLYAGRKCNLPKYGGSNVDFQASNSVKYFSHPHQNMIQQIQYILKNAYFSSLNFSKSNKVRKNTQENTSSLVLF